MSRTPRRRRPRGSRSLAPVVLPLSRVRCATAHRESGLSLIELMIAMTLLLVVMAATYGIWSGLNRTYAFTEDDLRAQEQARSAMGEMVELIRTARKPASAPSESLNAVIVKAQPNVLEFWADVDRDPSHTVELLRFRVGGDRHLYRDQAGPSGNFTSGTSVRLVTTNVSNTSARPLFSYLTAQSEETTGTVSDPTTIREITIDLLVDIYIDRAPVVHQLTSVVQPRNLRTY